MTPETARDLRQLSLVSCDHDLLGRTGPWRRRREASSPGAAGPRAPHQLGARVSLTSWPRNQEPARH